MSEILLFFLIGIGLSMDAFSLAILYGTSNISKKNCLVLSIIVGIFHFIMPNLGSILSNQFLTGFIVYANTITGIVFLILTIQMALSLKDEEQPDELKSFIEMILFAIAVSIDSFTLGIALSLEKQNIIFAGLVFSVTSFIFTLIGLLLGNYLSKKTGRIGKYIGVALLLMFSIKYLFGF